jgi:hypothetical protein
MNILEVPVLKSGQEPVLAGRLDGRRGFVRALEDIPPFAAPAVVALDFTGVDLATASYLSELVLPLRDHLRLRDPAGYVVAANLSAKVFEEMDELLTRAGEAMLVCEVIAPSRITGVRLIGRLDSKLRETFELVVSKGETSAVELHTESNDSDKIGPTGWNNRLSALSAKSLVREIPQGRTKKYRPVLEALHGT